MQMKFYNGPEGVGPRHYQVPAGVQVLENGDVRFTYYAPDAHTVEVAGLEGSTMGGERHALKPVKDGYWQADVAGIPAGFHYHVYFVNGNCVLNPQAPFGYGCHQVINFFEQPDPKNDFYLEKDVPHGSIHMHVFHSSRTGNALNCVVYTPPGYELDKEKNISGAVFTSRRR